MPIALIKPKNKLTKAVRSAKTKAASVSPSKPYVPQTTAKAKAVVAAELNRQALARYKAKIARLEARGATAEVIAAVKKPRLKRKVKSPAVPQRLADDRLAELEVVRLAYTNKVWHMGKAQYVPEVVTTMAYVLGYSTSGNVATCLIPKKRGTAGQTVLASVNNLGLQLAYKVLPKKPKFKRKVKRNVSGIALP